MIFEISWLGMGIVGCLLGSIKKRPVVGFLAGIVLGPVGWVLLLCAEEKKPGVDRAFRVFLFVALIAFGGFVGWKFLEAHDEAEKEKQRLAAFDAAHQADAIQLVEAAPSATPAAAPAPRVERAATQSPAEVNAEIARKYGARP